MAELKIQQNALLRGTSCWVRAGKDASSAKIIGYCDSFRGSKNLQLQRAQVCGSIYPVSIDPQGVSTTISISGFVPTKSAAKEKGLMGSGDVNIMHLNPDEKSFIENEQITKIPYLDFYDKNTNTVVAYFTDAVPQSFNVSVNGGSYIKGDMSLEALTMSGGSDYAGSGLAASLSLS